MIAVWFLVSLRFRFQLFDKTLCRIFVFRPHVYRPHMGAVIGVDDLTHIDLCAAAARDFRLYPAGAVGNAVFFEQFFERFELAVIPTFVNFNFFYE